HEVGSGADVTCLRVTWQRIRASRSKRGGHAFCDAWGSVGDGEHCSSETDAPNDGCAERTGCYWAVLVSRLPIPRIARIQVSFPDTCYTSPRTLPTTNKRPRLEREGAPDEHAPTPVGRAIRADRWRQPERADTARCALDKRKFQRISCKGGRGSHLAAA